jgi:hypothetical protein
MVITVTISPILAPASRVTSHYFRNSRHLDGLSVSIRRSAADQLGQAKPSLPADIYMAAGKCATGRPSCPTSLPALTGSAKPIWMSCRRRRRCRRCGPGWRMSPVFEEQETRALFTLTNVFVMFGGLQRWRVQPGDLRPGRPDPGFPDQLAYRRHGRPRGG